jgi:hypothetical protein
MDYFKRKMTFKVLIDKEIEFRGERWGVKLHHFQQWLEGDC